MGETEKNSLKIVNLNLATVEEIDQLPGVGAALAEAIVAARPFETLEDVLQVKGMGPKLLANIQPFATVALPIEVIGTYEVEPETRVAELDETFEVQPSPVVEPAASEQESLLIHEEVEVVEISESPFEMFSAPVSQEEIPIASEVQAGESDSVAEPTIQEESSRQARLPVARQPAYVTRRQLWWSLAGFSFLTFLLAVFSTLIGLSLLNGGLRFARVTSFNRLAGQVETLNTQLSSLNTELQSLETRLAAVESLGEEVEALRSEVDGLSSQLDSAESRVETLAQQIGLVNTQIDELSAELESLSLKTDVILQRTGRFQAFLDGLQLLLQNLASP